MDGPFVLKLAAAVAAGLPVLILLYILLRVVWEMIYQAVLSLIQGLARWWHRNQKPPA